VSSKLAPLRLGSPIRFRDRWEGRLSALEVDAGWEVINLVASRGLLWSSDMRLPFTAVSDWSGNHVVLDCTSDEAFGRRLAPVAAHVRVLLAKSSLTMAGVHLAGALVERAQRRVRHLLIRQGVAASQERKVAVEQVSLENGCLRLVVQVGNLPLYRGDEDLRILAREALARHPYLTADDRRGLVVEGSDGTIRLAGNVRTPQAKAWAAQAASVDEAVGLQNEIMDDIHLEIAVAQALEQAGLFRTALVYLRSSLGQVTLFGSAPSAQAIEEIVRVASRVPGVRSVASRLEVRVRSLFRDGA